MYDPKEGKFHEHNQRHFTIKYQWISPHHRGYIATQTTNEENKLSKPPTLHQPPWKRMNPVCVES